MTVTLLGLPYDASSSFQRGAAAAPVVIRRALASDSSNLWTEALVDLGAPGVLADAGDVDAGGGEDGAAARAAIEAGVAAVLAGGGGRPLSLGGDHSVTYPALRAMRRAHPRGLAVVQLDAHPDLYDAFDGDRFSHACPFARAMEEGLADRLVQLGIRTMNGHQRAQADRFGVEVVEMRAWGDGSAARARLAFDVPVYVTVDLDALDPAFAPGISHREPGGLTVRQALDAIHAIRAPAIVGADVVEFNPANDVGGVTAMVCAKLVKELAGRMLG
ncbi:MAG TPA: agmatinase [Gemmatimonadaceae bacterium]|nr:agmatinase [Gemmatimonadaceae bacterium]